MRRLPAAVLAVLTPLVTVLALLPSPVLACGGCFVPPGETNAPVLQNAERILFAHDTVTKKSYVWVEIRYAGPPGDFSWVLPLPKQPDVSVGDSWLFDRLDVATGARFQLDFNTSENCSFASTQSGFGCGGMATSATGSADYANGGLELPNQLTGTDGVAVLKHAQVGKYDYALVQATSKTEGAAKMVKWLQDNHYAVPDKAKTILDDHVARGDVFVALKLVAGASVKEIRPIALTMDDAEPCVPLRLTSIAAEDDMNVVVTLAGEGRAIPKNHLHVVVNPARIDWFGQAQNYPQVLAAAMDEAAGRAFVTEYAGKLPKTVSRSLGYGAVQTTATFDLTALNTDGVAKAQTRDAAWRILVQQQMPITQAVAEVYENYFGDAGSADPVTYYQALATSGQTVSQPNAPIAGGKLASALDDAFCKPVREMAKRLGDAPKVTRLVMRISPQEMTKDPVFAFSATLPDVSNVQNAAAHGICRKGDSVQDAERLTLANLGSWVFDYVDGSYQKIKTAADPRFATAPAALRVELLDETGDPLLLKPEDIGKVDVAIAGAHAGKPSLDIVVQPAESRWTPPQSDGLFGTSASSGSGNSSCQQGRSPAVPGGLLLACVAAIWAIRRRRAE